MKQYTTPDQTARLIELGFEKPKSVTGISWQEDEKDNPIINANTIEYTRNYSIGELIEIIDGKVTLEIDKLGARWIVSMLIFDFTGAELVDCLFDACVKLKEEGVI